MKQQRLSFARRLAIALLAVLTTVGAWAQSTITESTTWADGTNITGTVTVSGGTESNPIVITVQGTVTMEDGAGINISDGTYLKLAGESGATIVVNGTSNSAIKFDSSSGGFELTLDNLTFDGGDPNASASETGSSLLYFAEKGTSTMPVINLNGVTIQNMSGRKSLIESYSSCFPRWDTQVF